MNNHPITYDQLCTVEMPPPWKTSITGGNWKPIPHHELVAAVMEECTRREDWEAFEPVITLSKDKRDMTLIVPMRMKDSEHEHYLLLGMVNSNSGQKQLRAYIGVEVGHDQIWLTQLPFTIKHLKSVDLQEEMKVTVERAFIPLSKRVPHEISMLKQDMIAQGDVEALLMKAGRKNVLPWRRIGMVDSLFFRCETHNQWNLLVCFAHALTKSPANQQMDKAIKFRRMLP